MDPSPERFIRIRHFPGILATPHIHPRLSRICVLPLHGQYALHLRCVHKHTLQLHNERERKIPHWGACHAGEHATLRNMPRWGTCHAGEHATLGSMLTGHHGSHILLTHCKCAAAFHHAANTPQLNLRNASALTRNRFFYTTHADSGLFISPVRLFRTIHSSKDLRSTSIRPHTYLLNGSSLILTPTAPDHKPP